MVKCIHVWLYSLGADFSFLLLLLVFLWFSSSFFLSLFVEKIRTTVIQAEIQDFVVATGTVKARDDVTLVAEEGGIARNVLKKAGDRVKEGDILVQLESESLQADVKAQIARVQSEQIRLERFLLGPGDHERKIIELTNRRNGSNLVNTIPKRINNYTEKCRNT